MSFRQLKTAIESLPREHQRTWRQTFNRLMGGERYWHRAGYHYRNSYSNEDLKKYLIKFVSENNYRRLRNLLKYRIDPQTLALKRMVVLVKIVTLYDRGLEFALHKEWKNYTRFLTRQYAEANEPEYSDRKLNGQLDFFVSFYAKIKQLKGKIEKSFSEEIEDLIEKIGATLEIEEKFKKERDITPEIIKYYEDHMQEYVAARKKNIQEDKELIEQKEREIIDLRREGHWSGPAFTKELIEDHKAEIEAAKARMKILHFSRIRR